MQAGTYSRSRTLAEEIAEALPRYVQSSSFERARALLRKERVIVIAGQPGIGKTTLARLLAADAVLDRYEPIEVSNDV
jgi:MoxR-like ATPase